MIDAIANFTGKLNLVALRSSFQRGRPKAARVNHQATTQGAITMRLEMRFKQRLTLRTEPEDASLVRVEDMGQVSIIPYAEFSGRERIAIDIKVNPVVAWEKGAPTGIADSGRKRHLLCFIRDFFPVFDRPKNLTIRGKIGCGDPVVRRQQVMQLVLKIRLPGQVSKL